MAIREATGLGTNDAKALAEAAPITIMQSVPKSEADTIAIKFEKIGAKIILR